MSGWPSAKLSEVAQIVTGGTPSKLTASFFGGAIPFVTPGDLDAADPITNAASFLTQEGADEVRLLPHDAVLVSCIGTLGKVGISGVALATNQQINALIFDARKVVPRYGMWAARTLRHEMEQIAPSTTLKIINKSRFSDLAIPLPPLIDQRRIAAILDQADDLRSRRLQALAKLNTLTQCLFSESFPQVVSSQIPHRLSDLADVGSGLAVHGASRDKMLLRVPYVRVANVQAGFLKLGEMKEIGVSERELVQLRLQPGDVLMTEGGDFDKLGRGAMWSGEIDPCVHQNHVFRVRLDRTKLLPEVFALFLNSRAARSYFLRCAKKTSNLASINMTQLRALPTPQPPLSVQLRFIEKLATIRSLESRMRHALSSSVQTFASLQHRAFRGEL